jgi:hypothetical protein
MPLPIDEDDDGREPPPPECAAGGRDADGALAADAARPL